MMLAVEKPSVETRTMTSATYKTIVTIEMTNVAAAPSRRLLNNTVCKIIRTIFTTISPRTKKGDRPYNGKPCIVDEFSCNIFYRVPHSKTSLASERNGDLSFKQTLPDGADDLSSFRIANKYRQAILRYRSARGHRRSFRPPPSSAHLKHRR